MQELLLMVSNHFGSVPMPNDMIALPDNKHLPIQFSSSTAKWKTLRYENPGRSKDDPISFFSKSSTDNTSQISSVRRQLLEDDAYVDYTAISTSVSTNPGEALNYADANFYNAGDLQADHLQPSIDLIRRQQELIEAMNLDPHFGEKIAGLTTTEGYFIKDSTTQTYVGTKYFYMSYHNCIDNLWLICTSDNTGQGKCDIDPVLWLRAHPLYGMAFFDAIDKAGGLDLNTIIYTVGPKKTPLAKFTKKWFNDYYSELIVATGYSKHHISQPLQNKIAELLHSTKHDKLKAMARLSHANLHAEVESSDTDIDSKSRLS